MAWPEDIARYRTKWQGEIDAAALYRTMAEVIPPAAAGGSLPAPGGGGDGWC
jgi:hypothetical protein